MSELLEKIGEWISSDDAVWFFFGWETCAMLLEPNWTSAIFMAICVWLLSSKDEN
jgi:hypothetical protein